MTPGTSVTVKTFKIPTADATRKVLGQVTTTGCLVDACNILVVYSLTP